MPRVVVALLLSLAYAGVIIQVAGVRPANGFPLWFFAPGVVAMFGALIAQAARRALPAPWARGEVGGEPPRAVQLSWYAVFRLSGYVPILFFPWYLLSIVGLHFDTQRIWWGVALLALVFCIRTVRRTLREIAVLRDGAVTAGVVVQTDRERTDLIHVWYHFEDANGRTLKGHAWRPEPVPAEGYGIPVYFDVADSRRHVIAGGSWFEAT